MASINVNSDVTDEFYRYKMPRLIAKVEGKGNGIKTVIVNMPEIAKALSRPPTYPTKFFGCELGAQTQFDQKNERFIVNGSHDASKLQSLLDGFIKKFVLCQECSNPETILSISQKNQTIKAKCIACGHTSNIDMRHKLTTFILKNPPDQDTSSTTPSKGSKKDKRDRKGKKAVNGEAEEKNDRNSPEVNSQEQMAAQRASGGIIVAPEVKEEEDDEDWGVDTDETAVAERMREQTEAIQRLTMHEDLEKTANERMNLFYDFLKSKISSRSLSGADMEVLTEAERLEVKDKAALVLVELLMDEKVLTQIKQHRKLLLRFCHNNQKAQKYLLGGIEMLVGDVHKTTLMPKVPHILKELYDCDIVDEEVLIEWGKKVSKKYVSKSVSQEIHDKAAPFIKWLEEAEEEDSEEDEEVEVAFSTTGKVGVETVAPPKPATPESEEKDDDGDEIDIDAI